MAGGMAIEVVAAVVVEGGKVLLAKRLPGGPHGGMWEFPGGKVEPGEDPRQALAREMMEELGAKVSVGEELARVSHAYPHVSVNLTAFLCRVEGGELRPLECEALMWVYPGDFPVGEMPLADLPIVEKIRDFIGNKTL